MAEAEADLTIHPEAQAALEVQAKALLVRLHAEPRPALKEGFSPDRVIAATLRPEKIIDLRMANVSPTGRKTAEYFEHNGNLIGFKEDAYEDFVRLCESIQRLKPIRPHVSLDNILKVAFEWVRQMYKGSAKSGLFAYALPLWKESLALQEIWIPLCETFVQSEFRFGHITVKPFQESFFKPMRPIDVSQEDDRRKVLEEFRRKLQGRAAATMQVYADPERAYERALEETQRSLGALRFFSRPMLVPGAIGTAGLIGIIDPPTDGYFVVKNSMLSRITTGIASIAKDQWMIRDREIKQMFVDGISILHNLLTKQRTAFEDDLLDSILLYTRAAATDNIADRLMYVFSALESFLLKDGSEPLQHNISDRIAYLSADDGARRREIIKNYKDAYELRSKYVHHGQTIDDAKKIDSFFLDVWTFYMHRLLDHTAFTSRKEMFAYIDKLKYG